MTILKLDDEAFSIFLLALNECGYDIDELDIELYDEVEELDKSDDKSDKIHNKKTKKLTKKKSSID